MGDRNGAVTERFAGQLMGLVKDSAVFRLDPDGRVLTWNESAERLLGYREDEILGSPFSIFYPREQVLAGAPEQALAASKAKTHHPEPNAVRIRQDGSAFLADTLLTAIWTTAEPRRHEGFTCVIGHVAAVRRADPLEPHGVETKAQDQARSQFLSIVAHELRNPMQGIRGAVELLNTGLSDDRRRGILEVLESEVDRLSRLLDKVMEAVRHERSDLDLYPVPTDLIKLLQERLAFSRISAPTRRFVCHLGTPGALVDADPTAIEAVFRNVLENAVKYSDDGSTITVTVTARDGAVEVRVADEGIGLGEGPADRPWGACERGANLEHDPGGMGLGLHLSRDLVERHGGRIWMESPGQGSIVHIQLPCRPEAGS